MAKKKSQATRRAEAAAAVRKEHQRAERRRRSRFLAMAVAVGLLLALGIGYAVQSSRDTTGEQATAPAGVVDRYAVPRTAAEGPVTVTVYEDFQCPFCREFEAAAAPVLDQYLADGDVQVHYRVMAFLGDYSARAANAYAVVLDSAGADVATMFHDLLFAHQPPEGGEGLADAQLVDLAVEAGARRSAVSAPIEEGRFAQWVENATDAASKDDVTSTPTVLVDDERIEYTTTDQLVAELENALGGTPGG